MPSRIAKAVRDKARKERLSINKTVTKLLEGASQPSWGPARVVHHDLDRFFGTWTKDEADAFDAALRDQRRVEPLA